MANTKKSKGVFSKVFGGNKNKSCCSVELEAVPEAEATQSRDERRENTATPTVPNAEKQPV
jgi:hypothetical protein